MPMQALSPMVFLPMDDFSSATCISVPLLPRSDPPRGIVRRLSAAPLQLLIRGIQRMADDHPRYRSAKSALLDWEAYLNRIPKPCNPSRVVWDWMLMAHGVPVFQRFNLAIAVMTEIFASSHGAGTAASIANMVSWIDRGPSIAPEFLDADRSRKLAKQRGYTFPLTEEENETVNEEEATLCESEFSHGITNTENTLQPPTDWNSPATLTQLQNNLKLLALPEPLSSHKRTNGDKVPGIFNLSYDQAFFGLAFTHVGGQNNCSSRSENLAFMKSLHQAYLIFVPVLNVMTILVQ